MTMELNDLISPLSKDANILLNVSPEDLKSVIKFYDVSPEDLSDMISSIIEWLKKQPHLPDDKLRTSRINGLLMFRGYRVEKVKKAIDDYFTARTRMPDLLCDRDPLDPTLAEYIKLGFWITMPKKTPENHRVTVFRKPFKGNCLVVPAMKISYMITEYRIRNEASLGDRWIVDLGNLGLNEVRQVTPVLISDILFYVLACVGARLKSVHIINLPPFAAAVVNVFKMMIKSKIGDRVYVTSIEDVRKILPKECLPDEYGGEGGCCQDIADKWTKTLQSKAWRQFFIEQNRIFSDESKRLAANGSSEMFGAVGSFRKLCVD